MQKLKTQTATVKEDQGKRDALDRQLAVFAKENKDLAALNYSAPAVVATAADRLRFLKTYLGVACLGAGDRRLARQIARKTRRIARHDARVRRATRTDA